MGEYSITQLSMKQSLLETQVERLEKLNKYLAEMCIVDMDEAVMNAIQDICSDIAECAADIKDAGESIGSYAFLAGQELKEQEKVVSTKTLKATLDSWDKARGANDAVQREGNLTVISDVEVTNPYVASVGEAKQDG